MRINRNLFIWPFAAAFAATAGSAAIAADTSGPDVLSDRQVSARLTEARASAPPPGDMGTLAADEYFAGLPSAGVVARCTSDDSEGGGRIALVRWEGDGLRDLEPGPARTVSGRVRIEADVVSFTARCVDGRPAGVYEWLSGGTFPHGEPPVDMAFGKWVESGLTVCAADRSVVPDVPVDGVADSECVKQPLRVLKPWRPRS